MVYEKYLSSGYCHEASPDDPREGLSELVLYNPTPTLSEATLTAYFTDSAPWTLAPISVGAETNARVVIPDVAPEVFAGRGFWGARVLSTTPLMLNLIDGVRISAVPPMFSGGATNFRGATLHRQWHFPDGLWLEWHKQLGGDVTKAPFPFNELEYYHFLNPHPHEVEVTMTLQFRSGERTTFHIGIGSERVVVWDNLDKVPYNKGYGVKLVATAPISAAAVRYIYGLRGLDEWGMQVHCAMWGVPGPITE